MLLGLDADDVGGIHAFCPAYSVAMWAPFSATERLTSSMRIASPRPWAPDTQKTSKCYPRRRRNSHVAAESLGKAIRVCGHRFWSTSAAGRSFRNSPQPSQKRFGSRGRLESITCRETRESRPAHGRKHYRLSAETLLMCRDKALDDTLGRT